MNHYVHMYSTMLNCEILSFDLTPSKYDRVVSSTRISHRTNRTSTRDINPPLYYLCWLCLTSHRQRGHLEAAPPFTVPCEGHKAR